MPEGTQDTATPTPEQQGAAATAGPQPNPAANPATNPATNPGASVLGTATQAQQTRQPQAPLSPQQRAAAVDTAHHSALGKIASVLLGKQTQYTVNPQTGQTVATAVQEKPGDLFRHILAGAILGAASAHGNSFVGGFAQGGAAVIQHNEAQDQQRRAAAQQQFQNQEQVQRQTREENTAQSENNLRHAQMQLANVQSMVHDRNSSLHEREELDRENASERLRREHAEKIGGLDVPVDGNGVEGKGADLMAAYTAGKIIAPVGHTLQLTKEYRLDGLKFDLPKGRWVDEETGEPVNLGARTTHHIQAVPLNAMDELRPYTGAALMKAYPATFGNTLDAAQEYNISGTGVNGLAAKEAEAYNKKFNENLKAKREGRLTKTATEEQARKDKEQVRKDKLAAQKLGQNQSKFQFTHTDPKTKEQVGWDGTAWVNTATGKALEGQ